MRSKCVSFFENPWYFSLKSINVKLTAESFRIFERYCFLSIFRKCVWTVMHDRVWIVSLIIWNLKFQFCELWKFWIFDIFPVDINKIISISTLMLMKESKRMHKFVERSSATVASITKTLNDRNKVFMKWKNMKYLYEVFFMNLNPLNFEKMVKI